MISRGVWSRPENLEAVSVDQNRPTKPRVLSTVILNTSLPGNSLPSPAPSWVAQGTPWVLRVYVSVQSYPVKPLQALDLRMQGVPQKAHGAPHRGDRHRPRTYIPTGAESRPGQRADRRPLGWQTKLHIQETISARRTLV